MAKLGLFAVGGMALAVAASGLVACTEADPLYCQTDADCMKNLGAGYSCRVDLRTCVKGDAGADGAVDAPDGGGDGAGGDRGDGPMDMAPESPPTCMSSAVCVAPDKPVCDTGSKMCRGCTGAAECVGKDPSLKACLTSGVGAGRCVGCDDAADCAGEATKKECDTKTNTCVECTASSQCVGATAPICDAGAMAGTCRKCGAAGECAARDATKPLCDMTGGACVACLGDSDCKDAGKPVCDATTRACRACGGDADCTKMSMELRACLMAGAKSGQCAECDGDGDCPTPAEPICDAAMNACRGCTSGAECAAKSGGSLRGCKTGGTCVECTSSAECTEASKPICDAATNTCKPCTSDAQCVARNGADPGVCMWHQDGRCAGDGEAIYVKKGGTCPGAGTAASPLCSLDPAFGLVTPTRRLIVLRGPTAVLGANWSATGTADPLTLVGQATAAIAPSADPGLAISGSGIDLAVRDLEIRNSDAQGVVVGSGAVIRLDRVVLRNNAKGGLQATGAGFDVRNCVFVGNGQGKVGTFGFFGGAYLGTPSAGKPARFEFSTVTEHDDPGVACEVEAQPLTGCLLFANDGDSVNCTLGASKTTADGPHLLTSDYHLTSASPCRNFVTSPPADAPTYDIDGDPRPTEGAHDCGADEYVP